METHRETQERKAHISTNTVERPQAFKGAWFKDYQLLPTAARDCIDNTFVRVQRDISASGYKFLSGYEEGILNAITMALIASNPDLANFISQPEGVSQR